jgi:hypothetical protein
MKSLGFLILLMLGLSAHAGILSSEPPKEFLALKVTSVTSHRQTVTHSIQEFVDVLKMDDANQISWAKVSDSVWALKVKRMDKMTDVTTKMAWEFAKREKETAVLKRMSADDVVLNSEFEIMNGFQTWATVIDAVQKKAGVSTVAKTSPKKSPKANSGAAKAVIKIQEPEILSKGLKGSYVQQYAEDANSSAFSIEELSPESIRLVATAPVICSTVLNLKKGFADVQLYAKAANAPDFNFEIFVDGGDIRFESRVGSKCSGPCCDLRKTYLRQ